MPNNLQSAVILNCTPRCVGCYNGATRTYAAPLDTFFDCVTRSIVAALGTLEMLDCADSIPRYRPLTRVMRVGGSRLRRS